MAETCYWGEVNISIPRGDSQTLVVNLLDENGDPYIPQDGDKIFFTVKKSLIEEPVIKKYYPNGGINYIEDDKTFEIEIQPKDTDNLRFAEYLYDVQCNIMSMDEVKKITVLYGGFLVREEVTTYKDEIL